MPVVGVKPVVAAFAPPGRSSPGPARHHFILRRNRTMAYTPQLSREESAILRRLAWAIGKPMTTTLTRLMQVTASHVNPGYICPHCKDRSICKECPSNR
jgi:hypothetical protein